MDFLLDFILHIDQYMVMIVRDYHAWTYAILFFIIFCETGLVVTPFLPGDSLLFVAGAISALPDMPISAYTRYHFICRCRIRRFLQLHDRTFLRSKAF